MGHDEGEVGAAAARTTCQRGARQGRDKAGRQCRRDRRRQQHQQQGSALHLRAAVAVAPTVPHPCLPSESRQCATPGGTAQPLEHTSTAAAHCALCCTRDCLRDAPMRAVLSGDARQDPIGPTGRRPTMTLAGRPARAQACIVACASEPSKELARERLAERATFYLGCMC